MQGQRSSVGTMAENVSIDHGSTSSDVATDPQLSWNSIQTPSQNRLPDYRLPSTDTNNTPYLQHVRRDAWNAEWSLGESSASQHHSSQNERKAECTWPCNSRVSLSMEEPHNEPSNILALDNFGVSSNGNQASSGSFCLQNSSYALSQDLNMSSGFEDQEDDGHQGVKQHGTCVSVGSSSAMQSAGCSSSAVGGSSRFSGQMLDNGEDRPGCSLDGRRMSCKRKAIELNAGPSSGVGSSNYFQNAERSQWHNIPASQIPMSSINMPMPAENDLVINNGSEQPNRRLRLGVAGAVSATPFPLTPLGNASSSRRNCRLRVNGLNQQGPVVDNPFSTEADVGNVAGSSSQHPRPSLRNRFIDLNPSPAVENGNLRGQSMLHVPSMRRNHQSRWVGPSSTRASSSSSSAIPEEWNPMLYEEPAPRNLPRSISEHPMFIPAGEIGSSSQTTVNWNSVGGNTNVSGDVPVPRVGPGTGAGYSAPSSSHRNSRRLSEIFRRSSLSSAGIDSGSQSSNHDMRSRSFAAYQEMALPHRPDNHRHWAPNSRSLDRPGAFAVPYSLRSLAAATEGRSGVMSEIRHVLDLMRRGEGLRLEDVMILNHSVFFGMADMHDRHRDMRLDVDNMSYEELLALEERIGNVCIGLGEETILRCMKQHKYADSNAAQAETETEPCSICREEYNAGEDIGTLNCGHDFHRDCIKQWLLLKNLCPICKTTGLTT